MYSEKTLNHFRNPKFAGEIKDPDAVGEQGNVKCGDMMRVYLKIEDNVIKAVRFQTYGCVAAIAASDALCKLAESKTLKEARKITYKDIVREVGGLPPIKVHCSVLGIDALKHAIDSYVKSPKNQEGKESKGK
ncbi:MAG: iron-sulfur cluster assembly scaffold protein [Thermoplasmata archaeon]|nr:MAG: iron-sulfur cluster assembly scaffold protein [Thermoplasmata archaeon]